MGNNIIKVQLFVYIALTLSFCNEDLEVEQLDYEVLKFSHLCIGYPSDSSKFSKYTDTVTIQSGGKNKLNEMFLLLKLEDSLLNVFNESDLKYSKPVSEKITQFYFGDYLRQYLGYVHDDYGLVYLVRADWEKDEYRLVTHPQFKQDDFYPVVLFCVNYHDNRTPPMMDKD